MLKIYDFIEVIQSKEKRKGDLPRKLSERGSQEIVDLMYDYIGNIDADMSLKVDYYESIMVRFKSHTN